MEYSPQSPLFTAFTRENKKIKAPASSNSILRLIHDWWREKIFSLPGEAPPKFVVARPWWRRVKEA
jgi:hypothetical protein